jgi:hypothetical protein
MEAKINIEEITKRVMEERRQQEILYHKERVIKLLQEKIELELRLLVVNETLKKIDEFVKENPHLQE